MIFITVLIIGFLVYLLSLSKKELIKKDNEIIEIKNKYTDEFIEDNCMYDSDDFEHSTIFYRLLEDERQKVINSSQWHEVDYVIKYYEDNDIYLPNELVIKLLRFDDRKTMFEFMEVQRKTYARMLTNPIYKPKRKTLPKK